MGKALMAVRDYIYDQEYMKSTTPSVPTQSSNRPNHKCIIPRKVINYEIS